MRFHIKTYGCQMNRRDTEAISARLESLGLVAAPDESSADVLMVNTCSVRAKAEAKAIGKLGLLVAAKRTAPRQFVGAIGCMVQRMGSDLLRKVPGLDFAVGTHRLRHVPEVIDAVRRSGRPIVDTAEDPGGASEAMDGHTPGAVSAFVSVLFGCNRRCSYCIVPAVRGGEWSRAGSAVVSEVRQLAAAGVREVTLLGQSVMSYGRGNPVWAEDETSPRGFLEPLPRLLEAICAVPGIVRVRFTSGHPSGCTSELARAMADLPAVCEHLHLPLQSGSDRILDRMRRGYTAREYAAAVERLRTASPRVAITTDVIVGFPSETEREFEETAAFMEKIGFDNAFIFKYSPRPDTPAAEWPDDIPADEKARRNRVLLEEQDRRSLRIHRDLVGRIVEVLVEGPSDRNSKRWTGRTRTNKIVLFDPIDGMAAGARVQVKVERAMPQTLHGTVEPGSFDPMRPASEQGVGR